MLKKGLSMLLSVVLSSTLAVGCGQNEKAEQLKTKTDTTASEELKARLKEKPENKIVFRLAENQPEDYPTTLGDYKFAKLVEERTDGRIKIEVYADEQLGDERSVIEQIQFEAIDFARVSISPLTEFEASLGALILPYLYRDKEHMFKVLEGSIGEQVLANLEQSAGIVGLAWLDSGSRSFYNTKKEIKTPNDMKGLKIRVQETEVMMDLVEALEALPVAMAYGDVYSALQTGVIHGAENNWPSFESSKHYEVAKFFTIDEHTRVPELIITNKQTMEKLSVEYQEIIRQAAQEAAEFEREEWLKREEASKKIIEESGVTITYLESNAEFQEKVRTLYDKHGANYKDIIDGILTTK